MEPANTRHWSGRDPIPDQLENEIVLLRRYTHFDAEALLNVMLQNRDRFANDFASRLEGMKTILDAEHFVEQKYLEWIRRESFHFGIWEKRRGTFAGEIVLKDFVPEIGAAEIGYFLAREFEGQGLMSASLQLVLNFGFTVLGLNKLHVRCSSENTRSRNVAVRCGFILEGILRNTFLGSDGKTLLDMYYYGMTTNDHRLILNRQGAVTQR